MRRTVEVIGSLLALVLSGQAPAGAEESARPRTIARGSDTRTAVVISNPGSGEPGQPAPSRARRREGPAPPGHRVTTYFLRGDLFGDFCLYSTTERREAPISGAEQLSNDELVEFAAVQGMPRCDTGNDPVPARLARAFVRTIPLPGPRPHIAPSGTAITGMPVYLETNSTLVHEVAPGDTPLGDITVEARSTYWVDWGDGSPEAGPFAFEGEAYPSGRITHNYQNKGAYTVTVRQRWTATWRMGSDTGTVEDLQTEASIPLQVGELQAVIR